MSADEIIVTIAAVIVGPVWWAITVFRLARVAPLRPAGLGVNALTIAVSLCGLFILVVLKTFASFDVVGAPEYQFMYGVLGLAWLRVAERFFAFAGLSVRDDLVERRNAAAVPAVIGALVAVTLCYAGGNIGDGPGWWVVVFSAGLATATLFAAWLLVASRGNGIDAVIIDRDPAAGVRLGAFLAACGVVLGRAVAGNWESAVQTIADFVPALPGVGILVLTALVIENVARPTPQRPRSPLVLFGIVPALLYFAIAWSAYTALVWPR
jgi:hypothetical protein